MIDCSSRMRDMCVCTMAKVLDATGHSNLVRLIEQPQMLGLLALLLTNRSIDQSINRSTCKR